MLNTGVHTQCWIDRLHATLRCFCLRHTSARIGVYIERLSLQVGDFHHITVDQRQRANTSARKQVNRCASERAATNYQRMRPGQTRLRRHAKPRQDHLPVVTSVRIWQRVRHRHNDREKHRSDKEKHRSAKFVLGASGNFSKSSCGAGDYQAKCANALLASAIRCVFSRVVTALPSFFAASISSFARRRCIGRPRSERIASMIQRKVRLC